MSQCSLGFVVVDGDTLVIEEGEVFPLVSSEGLFEFNERSGVSAAALCNLIEHQLEYLFLYGVIQLRELLIGLYYLFLFPFAKLSAFCHISELPLRVRPA